MRLASRRRLRTDPRRGAGARQDVALVLVLAKVVSHDLAFKAACRDDGYLAFEGDEALENHRRGPKRAVNRSDVRAFADQRLALAVIAEPPGLEDCRAAEFRDGAHQRARILDLDEGRGLEAEIAQERLFDEPVLGLRQRADARPDRHAPGQELDRRRRHVLELEGRDVDRLGEAGERSLVVEGRDGPRRRGVVSRRRRFGGEDMGAQPEFQRRDCEHPPELSGAENAYGGAGAQGHRGGASS